jgi:glutaminase
MITVYRAALAAVLVTAGGAAIAPRFVTTRAERDEQQTIQAVLDQTYEKFKNLKEGKNADYIPALAKVNPSCSASRS